MAPRWSLLLIAAAALALAPAPALSAQEGEGGKGDQAEDVDYVSLAARLLKDGHLDRAEAALRKVDAGAEDTDRARLFTLWGLIDLQQDDPAAAKGHLRRAIDAGQDNRVVYLYLAQAHYRLEEYADTVSAIERAGVVSQDQPSLYTMLARSHWHLGHHGRAFAVLEAAARRYPGNETFLRQKIFYLIDLHLYQRAAELDETYLDTANATVADYLAIGRALRRGGQLKKARSFLEGARLQNPSEVKLTVELAQVYLKLDQTLAAAHLYEQAAYRDPSLMSQAAELYRRTGKYYQALNLNAQIPDSETKLKQRLALLLQLKHYALAASMADALRRAGLLQNQDIRYALAFARFKDGDFDGAESQLARLKRSDLFRKAAKLREAMTECRDAAWKCY
ncbi:MAG TPA: hypothetical protein VKA55_09935 [Gammaproteobacteria bacterium]|nr:hypothetical protein [Gammaproteobacteria bacterium]